MVNITYSLLIAVIELQQNEIITNKLNSIDIIEDGEYLLDIPSDNKFICQIEISFDNKEPLRIIDLIEFDNSGKIKNLTAYKR